MSWEDKILKLTEIKTRYFFAGWVFGALIIFLPDHVKQQMAITIPESVRPWLGFSTLAAFVLWLVLVLVHFFSFARKKLNHRKIRANILSQLNTLSQRERDVFLLCLRLNQRTIHRNLNDAAANSLRSKGLLTASSGHVLSLPFTIPKFVWDYIKANDAVLFPELFDENAMKALDQRQGQPYGWMGL